MPQGIVLWFNREKGFGFILQPRTSDMFVHISDIEGEPLEERDIVEYEIGEGRNGPCAKITVGWALPTNDDVTLIGFEMEKITHG